MPLPPEVAKGMSFLPEKSPPSRNVSTIVGATYHQIGKPTKTVSYAPRSSGMPVMAGRDFGSFISTLLRLCLSIQLRSALV